MFLLVLTLALQIDLAVIAVSKIKKSYMFDNAKIIKFGSIKIFVACISRLFGAHFYFS